MAKRPSKFIERTIQVTVRVYEDALFMRQLLGSGTLGSEETELAVNLQVGPTHDDGVFMVKVGKRTAVLDNESALRAVADLGKSK